LLAAPRRLRRTLDRLDRELGRVSSNTPLNPAALAPLNLLHAPANLVEIVRPIAHRRLLPDFEADLHIV
jgi:hypothetical protein